VVKDDEQTARVLAELGADVPTWRAAQERAAVELRGEVLVEPARMRLATLEVLLATALALCSSPPPASAPSSPAVN